MRGSGKKKSMGKRVGGAKKKVGAKKFGNTAFGKKIMAKRRKK
tara:strand:- start:241 stop:369 length:129 start_codon:yes stop_codon:yes gene_type:complete